MKAHDWALEFSVVTLCIPDPQRSSVRLVWVSRGFGGASPGGVPPGCARFINVVLVSICPPRAAMVLKALTDSENALRRSSEE